MRNATASNDWYSEERVAWLKLEPWEKDAVILYNKTIMTWENVVPSIMVMEMLILEEKYPGFCSVLSVPQRLIK